MQYMIAGAGGSVLMEVYVFCNPELYQNYHLEETGLVTNKFVLHTQNFFFSVAAFSALSQLAANGSMTFS